MQATASLCRPAVLPGSRWDTPACRKLMQFVFNDFLVNNKIDKILLAASWKDEDLPMLSTTLEILRARGLNVTVLGPIVEYDNALPRLLAEEILLKSPAFAKGMRRPGVQERDLAMRRIVAAKGAVYVSIYDTICRNGICDEFAKGDIPLQFDAGHLTPEGSVKVAQKLAASFLETRGASNVAN
jgi:hypothetical protein